MKKIAYYCLLREINIHAYRMTGGKKGIRRPKSEKIMVAKEKKTA